LARVFVLYRRLDHVPPALVAVDNCDRRRLMQPEVLEQTDAQALIAVWRQHKKQEAPEASP